MNGAETLIRALADAGVSVCFANPGTSEMQLVAAIDGEPRMRAILGLFEGVVTGAADGYARMADKPALTLLHLGPGFGNGSANLHNAKRAHSPIINMIGDHATYHREYDAPLTSDIYAFASPVSDWIGESDSPEHLAEVGLQALEAARVYPGQIASFIVPADHAWQPAPAHSRPLNPTATPTVSEALIAEAAAALRDNSVTTLFLGGMALRSNALRQAGRIAAISGARIITDTFFTRLERGEGRVPVERLPYFGEQAADYLKDFEAMVIVGTKAPVSFFAYPGKPSYLVAEQTAVIDLADPRSDALDALTRLADALDAPLEPALLQVHAIHALEQGPLTMIEMGKVLANHLPENTIVADEGTTNSLGAFMFTGCARHHDWLTLTGGAIGMGLPLALGAAIACPDRKIIALQADGSAMYTPQALWTMVRENTDVTVILLNNSSYAILNIEMQRVGVAHPSDKAKSLLDLSNPTIDWVSLASGMGMPASRADTVAELDRAMASAMAQRGPKLIEVILPGYVYPSSAGIDG